uniref:Integrase catalytic domain-containing protein n=2 Tax=Cacopsylla melanoneura TaxID=428564 RepID=A0A8D8LZD7_9HEMI
MSSKSDQLKTLIENRNRYFQRIQRAYDLIKDKTQVDEFKERAKHANDTFDKFESTIASIEKLNPLVDEEDRVKCDQTVESFETLYYRVTAHVSILNHAEAENAAANVTAASSTHEPNLRVKLPTIQVPIFNGEVSAFPAWKSLFDELIHTNTGLSDIQKFSYLQSYVSGSARGCIEHVTFSATNYLLAYQSLCDRYQKKRVLANSYLTKILQFRPLSGDDINLLRQFLDVFHVNVESLRALNIQDLGEFMLLQLGLRALDEKTRLQFETENITTNFPTFQQLITFIKHKCSILDLTSVNVPQSQSKLNRTNQKSFCATDFTVVSDPSPSPPSSSLYVAQNNQFKCSVCQLGEHRIASCPKFLQMEVPKRFTQVKELRLCFACLSSTHARTDCKSLYKCKHCGSDRHHSLLHPNKESELSGHKPNPVSTGTVSGHKPNLSSTGTFKQNRNPPQAHLSGHISEASTSCHISVPSPTTTVLLGTAVVQVQDVRGVWHFVRCILDPGSQISIVSQWLAQLLGLPLQSSCVQVSGVGTDQPVKVRGELECKVLPHPHMIKHDTHPLCLQAVVLPKIAGNLCTKLHTEVLEKFSHLWLADQTYVSHTNLNPSIDLLIGAEHYSTLLDQTQPMIPGSPSAIPSVFGWILLGRASCALPDQNHHQSFFVTEDLLSSQIQRFWEIEEIPHTKPLNPEEVACERHFVETYTRDKCGKYVLRLPFKGLGSPNLGSNRAVAHKRLQSLDVKLNRNIPMKNLYCENLQSYVTQGHMSVATEPAEYLLVHHGVFKASSSTTKLRVVFDPNVASDNGNNLAKSLMVGPKLQKDIGDLLIGFRLHPVAITCDIQAMYRSIGIAKDDCKYQHILWHSDQNVTSPVTEFELTTVTFGLPPSPFQAQRVLQQLALDEGNKHPRAAQAISSEVYVDDIVTGAKSVSEAIVLRNEIISILSTGGFAVRKWVSSHANVLVDMPDELCEKPQNFSDGLEESIKVLGTQWCPKTDTFVYCVDNQSCVGTLTKRQVLSFISKIYDLNGLVSPITIWLKIFMQRLWLHKSLSWDTTLPIDLCKDWTLFVQELNLLKSVLIPRYVLSPTSTYFDLVGFADGSSVAICGAIYLRVENSDMSVQVHLLRAKTKVAPLHTLSIPRLELNAALLLARVLKSLSFLTLPIRHTYLFSDSTVVLAWLKTPPHCLKTYVANRVATIIEITNHATWHHVSTHDNAADPASRGLFPSELVNHPIWFCGPKFLLLEPTEWPIDNYLSEANVPELKSVATTLTVKTEKPYLITVMEKYSSLLTLERIFALVKRFIHNLRDKSNKRVGNLSVSELHDARMTCIVISQKYHFESEFKLLKKGSSCSSNLLSLSPFVNPEGILMVGGRLSQAPLPTSAKHPILISNQSHLAQVLISYYHHISLHGGPKLVQCLLQRYYWVVGARSLIRKIIFKCMICFRATAKPSQPIMADIPASRFVQGRPFMNVGVDLAGPFPLKSGPRSNSPITKSWFAIFICFATKAVHLELLTSLSTDVFLAALDRFVGRRGLPQSMFSDRGTNFVGAARQISELLSSNNISRHLGNQNISWIFNPPSAPNFGGLWEAGVKSTKVHLARVIQNQSFSYEMFSTLLIRIEAILNSRPICALCTHPDDGVDTLTPGHFLIGSPLLARPEVDVSDDYIPPLRRWALITQAAQSFWKRWRHDYINTLIQRSKWTKGNSEIKLNDVVLVQGQSTPSQKWPLGIVTKLLPGPDGIIRVVVVRTPSGELERPVNKLAVLPID